MGKYKINDKKRANGFKWANKLHPQNKIIELDNKIAKQFSDFLQKIYKDVKRSKEVKINESN